MSVAWRDVSLAACRCRPCSRAPIGLLTIMQQRKHLPLGSVPLRSNFPVWRQSSKVLLSRGPRSWSSLDEVVGCTWWMSTAAVCSHSYSQAHCLRRVFPPLPLSRQQCCRFFCGSRPMASVEELVAKANQLRRLRQEAGQKSRELKRQAMAIDAGQAVTPWGAKRVAMRVFALSGFNLAASTKYLRHKGRWSDDTGCRTWYHALPTESRAQLLHPAEGDGVARRQLAEARTFVEEEQLVAWIQLQNQAKGIAPTPGAVLDQGPVPPSWGGSLNSQRRRLRRLVARRGGRKAVFGGNEQLEPAVLERKARRSHSSCPCASP